METLLSSAIAAAVTLFFVRRHVKSLPPAKPSARPAHRKRDVGQALSPANQGHRPTRIRTTP
jgi:hypothetical protein